MNDFSFSEIPEGYELVPFRDVPTEEMVAFFENRMKEIIGSKVSIKEKKNHKGKIEIEYYSKEELERIIDLIQSIQG